MNSWSASSLAGVPLPCTSAAMIFLSLRVRLAMAIACAEPPPGWVSCVSMRPSIACSSHSSPWYTFSMAFRTISAGASLLTMPRAPLSTVWSRTAWSWLAVSTSTRVPPLCASAGRMDSELMPPRSRSSTITSGCSAFACSSASVPSEAVATTRMPECSPPISRSRPQSMVLWSSTSMTLMTWLAGGMWRTSFIWGSRSARRCCPACHA
ncbi:hypothetical protein D3C72_1668440 [compost metagenome]